MMRRHVLSNSQQQRWASQGLPPHTPDKGAQTLEKLLGQSYAQIGVITINWGEFGTTVFLLKNTISDF
jgi:hypothetical protein